MMNIVMKNREYYAKKLADYFHIDLNNENLKIASALGAYITKMKLVFKTTDPVISFSAHSENKMSSNLFNGTHFKRGTNNTYDYIQDALEMFGLKKYEKYDENKILKSGWIIPALSVYKTFEDYLYKETDFHNIKSGAYNSKIFTSIFVYLYGEKTELESIRNNYGKDMENNFSNYKSMFDYIYLYIFKEKNPYHGQPINVAPMFREGSVQDVISISSIKQEPLNIKIEAILDKEISKLTYFANSIKNTENPAEEKRLINYNRHVIKLRTIHREDLKEEFNTFKAAHNIIDEYITTYNLEKPFGNVQEAAHIVPVSDLIKEERFEDIGNKENGILLDPTTHKMFDKGLLLFSGDNTMLVSNPEKFPFEFEYKIPNGLLTDSRIEYIKEWKERFQKDND